MKETAPVCLPDGSRYSDISQIKLFQENVNYNKSWHE